MPPFPIPPRPPRPFSRDEDRIMDLLIEAHNKFIDIKKKEGKNDGHPMEMQEWVQGIHRLQSILEHRAFKRFYPEYFK